MHRKINYSDEALVRRRAYGRRYHATHRTNYSPEALARRKEFSRKYIAHLRETNPYYSAFARRLRLHHFSQQGYDALLAIQENVCPVCKKPLILTDSYSGETPTLDHDHSCCPGTYSCGKCIRGILHMRCNSALGCVDDKPEILRNAADYLERYAKAVTFTPTSLLR